MATHALEGIVRGVAYKPCLNDGRVDELEGWRTNPPFQISEKR